MLVLFISVWAIFFKEKDEVQAYSKTAELIDYKQSLGLHERLLELRDMNYLKNDKSKTISSSSQTGADILEIRRIVLSDDVVLGYGNNRFLSYLSMDERVDIVVEYYLPYTQGDKVKTKNLNALKNSISDYIRSLKKLNEKLDNLWNYQIVIDGSSVELDILKGYYEQLREQYRLSLSYSSELIKSLMGYVDKSVYNDNILIDTKAALFDSFARALSYSTTIDKELEPDYANDVRVVVDKIQAFESGNSIFSAQLSEYKFLKDYNEIYNHYPNTLDYIFGCKNTIKAQMSAGMELGNILEKNQNCVITILNLLGF